TGTTAAGITVTDTLDANTTYVSASGTGWTCGQSAGVVTCSLPTLAVSTAANPITIITTVPNSAPTAGTTSTGACTQDATTHVSNTAGVDLCNLASVATSTTSDPVTANNSASQPTDAARVSDLSITKTDGVASVNAGGTTTYT